MRRLFAYVFVGMALLCAISCIATVSAVTQNITYQGRLTDAGGNPLTGSYSLTFKLYDVESGGVALQTDTHSVPVTNGLFTTWIVFDQNFFNGRGLWLGLKVGADPEMTPRQELRPVPYALSLRPGAKILGSFPTFVLDVSNNGPGILVNTFASINSPGVVAQTTGSYSPGVNANTTNISSPGVYSTTTGDYSPGMHAKTTGSYSPGVIASTVSDYTPGVVAETTGSNSPGVNANTTNTNSPGIFSITTGSFSPGMVVSTTNTTSTGVYLSTTGTDSPGVVANTTGVNSAGIIGKTTGYHSAGVVGNTTGSNSPGVYGESAQDVGVYGIGWGGGYFTTNQGGTGWDNVRADVNVSTSYYYNPGVVINTSGYLSHGIIADTAGNLSYGEIIHTSGTGSMGVYIETKGSDSTGLRIIATNYTGKTAGMMVEQSSEGVGVFARSNQNSGIWATTMRLDQKYGLQTPDYIRALGYETGSSDVAEYMPIVGDVTPGTVLVIGADGKLQPSTSAYDTKVAGIVSTDPGVFLGAKEGGNPGEVQVAVAGRVPCKVDARYSTIYPGDLLTTSDTPGYAMKAEPVEIGGRKFYPDGTILGKALGTLESGTGTIDVIVTLQ